MAVRVALIVAALIAGAWLVVQEHAAQAEGHLTHIAFETTGPIPPAEARHAAALLRSDRRLNPDHKPDLFEGLLLAREGRPRQAVQAVQRVTRAEPEDLEAWALLATVAQRTDPRLAARAAARTRVLAPPVPEPPAG